jgi:putative ABC transport system ATP-binding protein
MSLFDRLHGDGQTLIVVTHEQEIADRCHRVITLKDGHLISDEYNKLASTTPQKDAASDV